MIYITDILSYVLLSGALSLLIILTVIDLKVRLLPDIYVGSFALLGLGFHGLHGFTILPFTGLIFGALIGGGLLLFIRRLAGFFYAEDPLGLGDVKLMAAAGLWLGPQHVLAALVIGSGLGVVHGLGLMGYEWAKTKQRPNARAFSLPAGPAFIGGIIITALHLLRDTITVF